MKFHEKLMAQMRTVTQKLRNDSHVKANEAIHQALQGLSQAKSKSQSPAHPMHDINPPPKSAANTRNGSDTVHCAPAEETSGATSAQNPANNFVADLLSKLGVPADLSGMHGKGQPFMPSFEMPSFEMPSFEVPTFTPNFGQNMDAAAVDDASVHGKFISGSFTNHAGTRSYKLYIPSSFHGQALPLVVMLHGCTQNPDDFAFGTRMNALAEEKQCLVAYPMQNQSANSSKCWNWFSATDQQRDQGEASIIAGITRQIIQEYSCDPRQIYVAGLSAGGAMAVIMGSQYPELYAAVGVHSGLPYASAHDLPSALAAMQGGASGGGFGNRSGAADKSKLTAIPVIVFHGDRDSTVHPSNGEKILAQSLSADRPSKQEKIATDRGSVPQGHTYTRKIHHDEAGQPVAEHWLIHGAGHAWSGGSARGTYTDGKGPDASVEMMRFFSTQVKAESNSTV